eukprot:8649378-Pyramimonas_sp.AAC.1
MGDGGDDDGDDDHTLTLQCTVLYRTGPCGPAAASGSSAPTTPPSRAFPRRALLGRLLTRVTKEP